MKYGTSRVSGLGFGNRHESNLIFCNGSRTKPEQNTNYLMAGGGRNRDCMHQYRGTPKKACRGLQCASKGISLAPSTGIRN